MKRRKSNVIQLLIVVVTLIVASGCGRSSPAVQVGPLQTESTSVDLGDAGAVQVEIELGAGQLKVAGGADGLLEADFAYNVAELKPEVAYSDGTLTVAHPDVTVGIRSLWDLDDYRSEWDLRLNNDVPTEMRVDVGAGTAVFDLGALALTSLDMNTGAGEVTVDLSGAASLTSLTIEMGAGKLSVDLSGDWQDNLDAVIKGGAGSMTLQLPRDVGVRVVADTGLGSINASGLNQDGDVYTNDAYSASAVALRVDVEGGIGEINLEVVDTEQAEADAPNADAPDANNPNESDLTLTPLNDELLDEFTSYIEESMAQWRIPGAAVAVVQDGEIVYAEGFGVRELGQDALVTPDTLFGIGSLSKSINAMLVASLVDEGFLEWDTPAVEIWPDFQLADPDATAPDVSATVTVRDLLSQRTGMARDDSPWVGKNLSAKELMVALAQVPVTGQPGKQHTYENMGVAIAGFLGALAAGGEFGSLFDTYASLMQAQVFGPIGMANSTVDIEAMNAHLEGARGHMWNEAGQLVPQNDFFDDTVPGEGIIPAGGVAASANDMARYLITHLNRGVSPAGERAVSAENLTETWAPQISIGPDAFTDRVYLPSSAYNPADSQLDYGMGWFAGTYNGVSVVTHPGNQQGWTAQMALLPESDTGVVILTNAETLPCAAPMILGVQYRLIELRNGLDNQIDGYVDQAMDTVREAFGMECLAPGEVSTSAQPDLDAATDQGEPAFDEQLASDLQSALEAAVASPDTNWPGAVLHVSSPEFGTWTGAAGLGDPETNTAMRPNDKFRGGSIIKPFVSVVILQMVEEGLLSLDDTLTAVLSEDVTSQLVDSDKITVRMLLNHSAGLPDFFDTAGPEIIANLDKVWAAEEFLEFAAAQEPWFAPGEAQAYSNTDYLVLGMIIDQASGRPWREEMRARIFDPLHLENTFLPEPDDATIPGDFAHGYADLGSGPIDMSEAANGSVVGAAGGASMVTNAEDMARFVNAVAANQLFQESDSLGEMLTVLDMMADTPLGDIVQGYSLGLMHIDFGGGIIGIGHSGDTPGYNTFVFHLPAQNMTISGAVNADDFSAGFVQLIPRALEVLVPGYAMAETPIPAQPAPSQSELSAALQGLVDGQVQEKDILGMAMAVRSMDGTVIGAGSGYSDPAGENAWTVDTQSAIASVTKSFTAVVIMQLIEEGKLTLDDTIDTWFPDQPNGDKITVRMLLSHTSGLAKYINGPAHVEAMQAGKFVPEWAPLDLVAEANEAGPVEEPGSSDAHYANTNFVLLGLVTEAITGNSWAQEVEARIIQPLDLQNTAFLSAEGILDTMVGGYAKSEDGYQNLLEEPWYPHASSVWSAGEIVATAADLLTFASALFDGDLVSSETLAVMAQPLGTDPDFGIMMGLGGFTGAPLPPGAFGMVGDIPGYTAFYMGVLDTKLVAVALINTNGGDAIGPSMAAMEYLSSVQSGAQEPTVATEIQVPGYRTIIDEVLQDDRPAIALRVTTPEFEVFETRGYADWENEIPLEKDHLSRIASVTKPFIATLTLMYHVEGKLNLDETITRYLPESMTSHIQYADQITIRQLLNHTSGVFDTADNPEWWTAQFENPTKEWTDAEAVEFAYDQPAYFEPGTGFAYSNTNYNLAGLILDEILGRHHSAELRSRVLDPLGLSSTFYEQHEEFDRDRLTHGYFDFDGDGIAEDYHDLQIDTGHADGGLISTVEDMETFITALFKNDDFPDAGTREQFMQELLTIVPVASQDPAELGSGPGITEYDYGYGKGYGHTGGTPGYLANMIHFPDHDVTLTLTWNGIDGGFESMGTVSIMFESLIEATFSALGYEKAVDENDASADTPAGNVYEDPQGRFSMPLVGDWTPVESADAFAHFTQAEPAMNMYIVAVESADSEGDDVDVGIDAALAEVDIDSSALTLLDAGGFGQWTLLFYELDAERGVAVLAQVRDDTTYNLIFTGNSDVTRRPPSTVMETIEGFTFAGEGDEAVLPATVEEFEAYANSVVEALPPGLSIVIAANGAVAYANGFGMADGPLAMAATAETVYPWASMTKIATATTIMQLYEQGRLDLDAPVADYLDYFPAEYPITVRQLLDHTAGLSDPLELVFQKFNLDGKPKPDPDEAARTYYEQFDGPMFEPGSALAYANMNFLTLGEIVAAISGQSYIDYVRTYILDPLGMTQTDFTYREAMIANAAAGAIPAAQTENVVTALDQARGLEDGADFIRETGEEFTWMKRYNIFAPWGGLIGPATDVMRFAQMHLNGGELDGVRILSPESVALMQEMQLSTAGDPLGHGLGWEIVDDAEQLTIQHSGSGAGVQALMRLYPDEGVAVVLMSNAVGYAEEEVVDAAANVVFSLLGGGSE